MAGWYAASLPSLLNNLRETIDNGAISMKAVSIKEMHEAPDGTVVLTPHGATGVIYTQFMVKASSSFDGEYYAFTFVLGYAALDGVNDADFQRTTLDMKLRNGHKYFYIAKDEEVTGFLEWFLPRFAQSLKSNQARLPAGAVHVDEWLDRTPMYFGDEKILGYVHFMLHHFRTHASWMIAHKEALDQHKLFVTYEGKRYRVTGASRMGDIYLHLDHKQDGGYTCRVGLDFSKLTDWGKEP
jgi:hypothetical protein